MKIHKWMSHPWATTFPPGCQLRKGQRQEGGKESPVGGNGYMATGHLELRRQFVIIISCTMVHSTFP